MLEACHELGLPATEGDAMADLKERPVNSLSLASAFHIVEHIAFDTLLTFPGLQALMKAGIIDKAGHRVVIRSLDRLKRLANDGLDCLPVQWLKKRLRV